MIRPTLLALALLIPGAGCAGFQGRDAAAAVRCIAASPDVARWAQNPEEARDRAEVFAAMIANARDRWKVGNFDPDPEYVKRLELAHRFVEYVRSCIRAE